MSEETETTLESFRKVASKCIDLMNEEAEKDELSIYPLAMSIATDLILQLACNIKLHGDAQDLEYFKKGLIHINEHSLCIEIATSIVAMGPMVKLQ